MKLNNLFVMGAAALAMTSGAAFAAGLDDVASAQAIWAGTVGSSLPSSNLIITGVNGGLIEKGNLYIAADGTFTSSTLILEARDYNPETGLAGDKQPLASWSYLNSEFRIDGQVTDLADITLTNGSTELIEGQVDKFTGGVVQLSVSNNKVLSEDINVSGIAELQVLMTASYEEVL